ncbi:SpvB/TcaC N-terminal domain-containing protein, partial [Burkholderia ubonensis]|uniref:SpvB/TcaC N-terminal domain-containing protein n=1 Tax=Burkholderia ubonensis TaxID=101571 RepID=UPI000AE92040
WLIHTVDGQLHCLGKHAAARIADPAGWSTAAGFDPATERWLFALVFDYGEHADTPQGPAWAASRPWHRRADPFSRFDGGFELRCEQLCQRIVLFHQLDELGAEPMAVRALQLGYTETPYLTQLSEVRQHGYRQTGGAPEQAALPPLALAYTGFDLGRARFRALEAGLVGLDAGSYQVVDLYGGGMPGNPDPASIVDGLHFSRMVRKNPLTLRDTDGRTPISPAEVSREITSRADSIEDTKQLQQAISSDLAPGEFTRSPKNNFENTSRRIGGLPNHKGVRYLIDGIPFLSNLAHASPRNHYIVIEENSQESTCISVITRHLSGESSELMKQPFFGFAGAWKFGLQNAKLNEMAIFRNHPNESKAAPEMASIFFTNTICSIKESKLNSPGWHIRRGGTGEAEKRALAYHKTRIENCDRGTKSATKAVFLSFQHEEPCSSAPEVQAP